ncbi:hypothetical protein B9Z55_019423 [Caenorhabditis nigoni]|uniref:Amiloride-sensitive sodium channel n=1 Tax=Caenorhabditis nigoni TaxID=1611254 RepID=A0A2G5TIB2_9PELO|nr:hypothetical protein B9Z55_019423 [Caenorhabditis nigoni]
MGAKVKDQTSVEMHDVNEPRRAHPEDDKPSSWKDALFGRRARKYAFIFIVAFLAVLTVKDVFDLFEEYFEYPKESDINIVFNESMTMPNVTFCMSRAQAWSHFKLNLSAPADEWDAVVDESLANMTDHDAFMKQPWDYRLVMEAYDMIATYSSLERETTAHGSARSIHVFKNSPRLAAKRKTFKKWRDILDSRRITFDEFTQKTGIEVLRRSMQRFRRRTFDDDDTVIKTKLRISWISQMQICYQPEFDKDNFKTIDDQGVFFDMLLSHNAENTEGQKIDCMSVDFHGRPSSLNRFMEGKGRSRDGFIDELCLGQRHEVTAHVTALYQMLENDEEGTRCRDVEDGEDSEFNCRSRCRMEMIRDACHCTPLSLSYLAKKEDMEIFPLCDYTQCTVDVQKGNYSDTECANKCFPDCRQIRFEVDHSVKGRMLRPDLTLVELSWGPFEYLTMEQQWKYTPTTFIAALGGSIGMWLGLSILSLIQLVTYSYTYFTKKIVNEKILKKGNTFDRRDGEDEDGDFTIDNGTERKKMSLAENPFAEFFPGGSPEQPKKGGSKPNSRQASLDKEGGNSQGYSANPKGARS